MPNISRIRHHHSEAFAEDWDGAPEESFETFFGEEAGGLSEEFGWFDEDWETAFPEWMESDPEWMEIHAAGFSHIDVARAAFPEVADADDMDVEEFLFEITDGMSEAELESFWSGLAKFGKKALSVAAPVVQAAAPVVGTAIGAAFGGVGAPIGGAIGSLVGSGVGALNAAVNAPGQSRPSRQPRIRRRRSRPRRGRMSRAMRGGGRVPQQIRRRPRRAVRHGRHIARLGSQIAQGVGQVGSAVGSQVVGLLQNPQIQQALLNLAQQGVGAIAGSNGTTISESAAIAGLIGGLELVLAEAQEAGVDLDGFDGDFAPEDFQTSIEAFETLVALIGEPS